MNITAKQLSEQVPGLREILDGMDVLSAPGRRALRERVMLVTLSDIEQRLNHIQQLIDFLNKPEYSGQAAKIDALLSAAKDINSTICRLGEGRHLDEVELFEIKAFAILSSEFKNLLEATGLKAVEFPDLKSVRDILDPDRTGTPHFHIFNSYDSRLTGLRDAIKNADSDSEECARLHAEMKSVENEVMAILSRRLKPYTDDLKRALDAIGELDILIAGARYAIAGSLCRPVLRSAGGTSYTGLFNPVVKGALAAKGVTYQPIDISFGKGVTLITGANMGGKTITLKSVAIAQALAQLGFFVPAGKALIVPVSEIRLCVGDTQSEQTGLSSFAAEMIAIDNALKEMKSGKKMLLLIDEPARTTNPEEGRALVAGFIDIFEKYPSFTIMTSHYSGLRVSRHWRVKGLSEISTNNPITPAALSGLMDYRLEANTESTPPREALRIATLLGIETEIISAARQFLNTNNYL